jgi:hypothetical protein
MGFYQRIHRTSLQVIDAKYQKMIQFESWQNPSSERELPDSQSDTKLPASDWLNQI